MKRLMTAVSLFALSASAAGAAVTPSPSPAPHHVAKAKPVIPHVVFLKYRVAPADEYFGKLKMSILGIRNTIKDLGYKVDADPTKAMQIMNTVSLTEDAMHDWEHKYPQDTWIPPAIFSLERLLAKIDDDGARAHAKSVMVWLVKDYPTSGPGKTGRHELAENMVGVKPTPPPVAAAPAPDASGATVAGGGANANTNTTTDGAAPSH